METRTPSHATSGLPRAARWYIGAVLVAGLTVAVLAVLGVEQASLLGIASITTLVVLATVQTVSIIAPLRFHHDGGVQGFNLTVATFLAMLVLADDGVAVVLTGATALLGYGVSTRSPIKTAFNTAQELTWAGVAAMVARALAGGDVAGDVLTGSGAVPVLAAAIVAVALNVALMAELFHHLEGGDRRGLLAAVTGPVTAIVLAGNTAAGVLLIILGERSPLAIVLALPLLAGLLLGYRGFAAEQEAGRRAGAMQRTSSLLLEAALDDVALRHALDDLRPLFGAELAILDTAPVDAPSRELPAGAELTRELDTVRRGGMPVLRTDAGGAMVVPVVLDGRIVGALAVAGRQGLESWGQPDLALLGTVAGEVAATLRARQLVDQLEGERTALKVETQRLGDILTSASDGIVLLDADGRIQACNPAMARLAGVSEADAIGRRWDDVLRLEHDGVGEVAGGDGALAAALAGAHAIDKVSVLLRLPDGDTRWLRCSAAPVRRDGALDGVVLVAVDQTREREVEQLRGDFLATVSHELRTPLTPLRGFLAVLRQHGDALPPDRLSMIHGSMDSQLRRLEDLIGDLLLVAEVDRSAPNVSMTVTEVRGVVAAALDLDLVASDAGNAARVSLVGGPDIEAMADEAALRRIARSLVSNAVKHTIGEVEVDVARVGDEVQLTVADRGDGIPRWAREAIFEPFHRLGDHLHRTQGPGLGLAIARALVEAQGGQLTVADRPGGGAVFTATLRTAPASTAALASGATDGAHHDGPDRARR